MKIKSAIFITSYSSIKSMTADTTPEYAFIGRSNVGKSSLINMLTGKKGLAKTSAEPGKTRLINHFLINDTWNLIDLPGYGYAKSPKSERIKMEKMVKDYLQLRSQLVCVFLLIDSRHEPIESDIEFALYLGEIEIPFAFVFTKKDKLSDSKVQKNINQFKKVMNNYWDEIPPFFYTSTKTGNGREEILRYISEITKGLAQGIESSDEEIV